MISVEFQPAISLISQGCFLKHQNRFLQENKMLCLENLFTIFIINVIFFRDFTDRLTCFHRKVINCVPNVFQNHLKVFKTKTNHTKKKTLSCKIFPHLHLMAGRTSHNGHYHHPQCIFPKTCPKSLTLQPQKTKMYSTD